jgi:hypothetical protein
LPGFVNAHSHAFQRGLRGHVQYADGGDSFWTWRERMYTLANSLTPEGMQEVARLAFREMLAAGFTTVGEFHYVHHQPDGTPYAEPDELALRVVAAAQEVGIRVVLLRVAYARAGFEVPANPLQRRFLDASPDAALDEWVGFVTKQLRFLFHAADSSNLPVPSALEARLLRQASLIDGELTAQMLRAQLVQRVLLFAPEGERLAHDRLRMRPPQRPQIVALTEKLEAAVKQLTAVTPPAR